MSTGAHRTIAILLLALVIAAGYEVFQRFWVGRYDHYTQALDQAREQLQRYQRLLAARGEIEAGLAQIQQDSSTDAYYLEQAAPPLAATALQQRVGQVVQRNGGNVASSQILPAAEEQGFTRVAIRLQLTGGIEMLQRTLHALESESPVLFVDNIQIRSRSIRQRLPVTRDPQGRPLPRDQRYRTEVQLITQLEIAGYMRRG